MTVIAWYLEQLSSRRALALNKVQLYPQTNRVAEIIQVASLADPKIFVHSAGQLMDATKASIHVSLWLLLLSLSHILNYSKTCITEL